MAKRIKGLDAHLRRLQRLSGPEMERAVGAVLFSGGEKIQVEAQVSITNGAKTGRIYTHEFVTINGRAVPIRERTSPHQASAEGEAPADDTGHLAGNIETVQKSPLLVEVSSNAGYSAPLEFGTSKMAARPFMAPARDARRDEIVADMVRAVDRLSKLK